MLYYSLAHLLTCLDNISSTVVGCIFSSSPKTNTLSSPFTAVIRKIILLTEITAAQKEVALSFHRVRGLYFSGRYSYGEYNTTITWAYANN